MGVEDVDGHKLHLHPERVAEWKKSGCCFPLEVEIGPTNRCNHRCAFCTLDWITHGNSDIQPDVMISALEDMARVGVLSVYFAGEGEPYLHPNISDFIKRTKELKMGVSVSTNGGLFDEEKANQTLPYLSWIRFSVDAGTKETHAKIHGVSEKEFAKVISHIGQAVVIKKTNNYSVNIGVQAVLTPENIGEMESLAQLVKSLGVDNFQLKPGHNHPKSSFSPEIYQFSQAELSSRLKQLQSKDFKVVVRTKSMERLSEPRNYKSCEGFHFYGLISATGDVIPCNIFYGNPEFYFGNINEKSFSEIWASERRKEVIAKVNSMNHKLRGEYRCRFDVMNRYLQRLKFPDFNDEFI